MEPKQGNEEGSNGRGQGGFLCRQSSTRWTPTTDQIRILKELYYNNGVRSPSADQIQRISARLRQYAPSSPVMVAVGHMGNYGYGSSTFDNSFRECSILSGGSSSVVGSRSHNMGSWIGVDRRSSPAAVAAAADIFEKTKYVEEYMEDEEEEEEQEIETLPLFPIHGGDRNLSGLCSMRQEYSDSFYTTTWYGSSDDGAAGSRTSLELSLNSYATISPDDGM
ncbi:Protein WUSCHEL, partial [Cucurbita argyrosperma subsp. sororia]